MNTPPRLAPGSLHVWTVALDPSAEAVETVRAVLAKDERERAARFYFDIHRRRFTVARGVLRHVLGRYLGCRPEDVRFEYGPQGKPCAVGQGPLRFNVSHSGEVALYGVTMDVELGVDVEETRANVDIDGLAERFFARSEADRIAKLPADERREMFFVCWTRKEAVLKATGKGLSLGLGAFDVLSQPGTLTGVATGKPELDGQWCVGDLPADPGYRAAFALVGAAPQVLAFRWGDSGAPPSP